MTSETIEKNKPQKFLFGLNIFDEPEEDEADAVAPPPTYSQEELDEAVRQAASKAHAEGRKEAFKEAGESLDRQVADVLEAIASNIGSLAEAEHNRERKYEQESVRLSLAVFKKIFPRIHEKYGFEELSHILEKTITHQEVQSKIVIEVPAIAQSGVQGFIEKAFPSPAQAQKLTVIANEKLPHGSCNLTWSDGGAIRDTQAIADEITRLMEEALAGSGANVHDSMDENVQTTAQHGNQVAPQEMGKDRHIPEEPIKETPDE